MQVAALLLCLAGLGSGDEPYEPAIVAASEEGRDAMARFTLPSDHELSLFAAEPLLANPICFTVDHAGDCYVAETFRVHGGVTDMRIHMNWLHEELANRTVAERVAMMRRHEGERFEEAYGTEHDRVRLLRDTDGDGTADTATVFAEGFNDPADGLGAGLLSYRGDVFYTCIPHLWRLRDADGDGRSDERTALSSGYGVHIALLGHDLHGLRIGPDGRLYFSCGDRGFRVETPTGVLDHTHAGAVLRCELDGSDLEVFATGLRNPQELVFDAFGNLWTGDNNSDGGDKARWVQVVEGGESGWRFAFQYVTEPVSRGPWNDEKLWHPHHAGQAAYIVPPVANLADGPSGLTYNPYLDAPEATRGHFFLCDFRGEPRTSGIHAFDVRPAGAGFTLGEVERFVWGSLVTDCDFGPEGDLYFSDWVFGWNLPGKGRIYRLRPTGSARPASAETAHALLAAGLGEESAARLGSLLAHPDQRVRQEAQFELVRRGRKSVEILARAAADPSAGLARLHGIWGLGMAGRERPAVLERLRPLLGDDDAQVRAQAARVLGDERDQGAVEALIARLADESPRVRMYAAIALGRLGDAGATDALFELVGETGDGDPVLRHAGVMGLVGCAPAARLSAAGEAADPHVRMAACLALRRRADPAIAAFLADPDPLVSLEAARAINDVPLAGAREALAGALDGGATRRAAFVRRALNACLQEGGEAHLRRVAAFAARDDAAVDLRTEALELLAEWSAPSSVDLVTGEWRPTPGREERLPDPPTVATLAVELGTALDSAPGAVAAAWARWTAVARAAGATGRLIAWVTDEDRAGEARCAAFDALGSLGGARLDGVIEPALESSDPDLRARALDALGALSPDRAVGLFEETLSTGTIAECRAVYRAMAQMDDPRIEALFAHELSSKVRVNTIAEELALDLMIAAQASRFADVRTLAQRYVDVRRNVSDKRLAPYQWSIFGGDRRRGKKLYEDPELSCLRCHPRGSDAATGVGPDLRHIAERLSRRQILESIVLPNARIAAGYEGHLLRVTDGTVFTGRVLEEDAELVVLQDADGAVFEIAVADIEARRADLSSMPEGLERFLTREQMRDLIEYVAGL
ncbi:MAG: HEAT repeat domain-containing protein [Planctomycetota bacterium]|jgi:quinoprotein glucose dehydrogenase|nr:HEAT repeat domain-containing protein [Planctomycetota bacterium]MDP6762462.1 HEAT repeat domain-containing protein [Planctomycetota bacterium]MDP6989278.1 HEAT repeat domain-containing protein [Planctomycetota bacterium]